MQAQSDLGQSLRATQEVATFFDKLFHSLEPSEQKLGRDLVQIARRKRLAIPRALEGYRITYDARPFTKTELKRTKVVVELPPRPFNPALRKLTFNGCASFSNKSGGITVSGKVCIKCSISLSGASCTLTITVTVGV